MNYVPCGWHAKSIYVYTRLWMLTPRVDNIIVIVCLSYSNTRVWVETRRYWWSTVSSMSIFPHAHRGFVLVWNWSLFVTQTPFFCRPVSRISFFASIGFRPLLRIGSLVECPDAEVQHRIMCRSLCAWGDDAGTRASDFFIQLRAHLLYPSAMQKNTTK